MEEALWVEAVELVELYNASAGKQSQIFVHLEVIENHRMLRVFIVDLCD
jgi:hypothetical protein